MFKKIMGPFFTPYFFKLQEKNESPDWLEKLCKGNE
jgi:hypothetical protein